MTAKYPSILPKPLLLILSSLIALVLLTGCGGASREDVRTLGMLLDEFQALNEEGSRQLASGAAQLGYPFILTTYEKQLDLIKEHRANYTYEGEVKTHLDTMEKSLREGVKIYKNWIDAGYDSENPAPGETTTVNDFAIDLTSAETALNIFAGR